MITVLTAADGYDLTELATVKALIGLSGTADDTVLSALITRASNAIADYCGRVFAREAVRESVPGNGDRELLLTRSPLVSIESVEQDGTAIEATEYKISDPGAGLLWKSTAWTRASDGQPDYWEIEYTAGYLLPGEVGRDLPEAIEQACIEVVKTWFLSRGRDGTIRMQETGDVWQGTFTGNALPLNAKQMLAPWRVYRL